MNRQDEQGKEGARAGGARSGEFSDAMGRLEKAVQELVTVTAGELSDRATSVIDETSKRLEAELRLKRATADDPETPEERSHRDRLHKRRHDFSERYFSESGGRASSLYIDKRDEKIAGVCAAIARYFGIEKWIVRMGALTGLVFMPQIVFPGYWIAYFVLEKRDGGAPKVKKRMSRRQRRKAELARAIEEAPEPPRSREPSRDLKHVATDLTQAELRLRRLEGYVTSSRYELQRELGRLERGAS